MDETADQQARRLTLGDEGGVETAQGNPFGPNAQGPLTNQAGVGEPGLVGLPSRKHTPPPVGSNHVDEENPDEDAYSHEQGWVGVSALPEPEGLVMVGGDWQGEPSHGDQPAGHGTLHPESWNDAYDDEVAAHTVEPSWTENQIGEAIMREFAKAGADKALAMQVATDVIARLHESA